MAPEPTWGTCPVRAPGWRCHLCKYRAQRPELDHMQHHCTLGAESRLMTLMAQTRPCAHPSTWMRKAACPSPYEQGNDRAASFSLLCGVQEEWKQRPVRRLLQSPSMRQQGPHLGWRVENQKGLVTGCGIQRQEFRLTPKAWRLSDSAPLLQPDSQPQIHHGVLSH